MLLGLIFCILFGWLALQWDATVHNYERDYKEAATVLKGAKEGKPFLSFSDYKKAKDDKYQAALTKYEQGLEKEKPKKPYLLKQADYEQVTGTSAQPFKFRFASLMIQFQMTCVAVLLLMGMLIRNTVGIPKILHAGTMAALPIIKPGMVILGAYYLWSDVLRVRSL